MLAKTLWGTAGDPALYSKYLIRNKEKNGEPEKGKTALY